MRKEMKRKNNKKGFTLIELLAVIVVLAIVMVLATSTVLPMIGDARKTAFSNEANSVLDAAKNAVSVIRLGTVNLTAGDDYKYTAAVEATQTTSAQPAKYCFTLQGLKDLQMLDKDLTNYHGTITVSVPASGAYTYDIDMDNGGTYYVTGEYSSVTKDNVQEGSAPSSNYTTKCQ